MSLDTSPQMSTADASFCARVSTSEATARHILDALAESLDSTEVVIAASEARDGLWSVSLHFLRPPNQAAVRALVALAAGAQIANALVFESIAATDWVQASLAGLSPVAAGRFLVHGAHDRARVPPNRIGIEIEAALAFGTGHHGTTRGCLIALDRFAQGRPDRRGPRLKVLDLGTGSGVLAIAAARALRRPVLASDNDPARGQGRAGECAAQPRRVRRSRSSGPTASMRAVSTRARRSISSLPTSCSTPSSAWQPPWRDSGPERIRGPLRFVGRAGARRTRRLPGPRPCAGAPHPPRRLGHLGAARGSKPGTGRCRLPAWPIECRHVRGPASSRSRMPREGAASAPRVKALRTELARRGLTGFIVPRADRHQNEYVPAPTSGWRG